MRPKLLYPSLLILLAIGCSPAVQTTPAVTTTPSPSQVRITVAGTTDLHGWVAGHQENLANGQTLRSGGLDVLGGYVRTLRESSGGRLVLVDSGDLFQGTLESNLFEGESVVAAYNQLGYSAVAVGNHEFDFGPVGPSIIAREATDDPLGAIKRNIALAKFAFLGANTYEKTTGKRPEWLKPSTMIDLDGVKIGIIGAITVNTPYVTTPANVTTLEFRPPAADVLGEAEKLRAAGAQVILVLAHVGGSCSELGDPTDLRSCRRDAEIMRLAESLPAAAVDLILAGHTHSEMRHVVNRIPIMQAAAFGRGLSVADLWVDTAKGRVDGSRTVLRPLVQVCGTVFAGTTRCVPTTGDEGRAIVAAEFEGKPVTRDARIANILAPFQQKVAEKKAESLGIRTSGTFTRRYDEESTIGNLVADALRRSVPGAHFAIVNSGGIRSDLDETNVSFGSIYAVWPFDSVRAVMSLTGAQMRELLRLGTSGKYGILQISGAKVVVDESKPENERIASVTMTDGRPLIDDERYIVVANDFLAGGGDGLAPLVRTLDKDAIRIDAANRIRDILIDELRRQSADKPLQPKLEDRIRFVR